MATDSKNGVTGGTSPESPGGHSDQSTPPKANSPIDNADVLLAPDSGGGVYVVMLSGVIYGSSLKAAMVGSSAGADLHKGTYLYPAKDTMTKAPNEETIHKLDEKTNLDIKEATNIELQQNNKRDDTYVQNEKHSSTHQGQNYVAEAKKDNEDTLSPTQGQETPFKSELSNRETEQFKPSEQSQQQNDELITGENSTNTTLSLIIAANGSLTVVEGQTTGGGVIVTNPGSGSLIFIIVDPNGNPTQPPPGVNFNSSDGTFTFNAQDPAYQHLGQGVTEVVTFLYQAKTTDGSVVSNIARVDTTVTGVNDPATIFIDSNKPGDTGTGSVTEDGGAAQTTVGTLSIIDPDRGEEHFVPITNQDGTYGKFSIDADGHWTYLLNNGAANVQALGQNEHPTETFKVTSQDGTATYDVIVTVNGVNDAPIAQNGTANGNEDTLIPGAVLATDDDGAAGLVYSIVGVVPAGLTFNPDGTFTLDAHNTAYQALTQGETQVVTFHYKANDGASDSNTGEVNITVTGVNDLPIAQNGAASGNEDTFIPGAVHATDVDHNTTLTYSLVGAAPAGLAFNPDGTFTLDTHNAAYQSLAQGETQVVTFHYKANDGLADSNTAEVNITVTGTNDIACITGDDHGNVKEDVAPLSTTGILTITDADAGQAHFVPITNQEGTYGKFSIDADGHWTYALKNGAANVQALKEGETHLETFTVTSQDGTDTQNVTITVKGTNDIPIAKSDIVSISDPNSFISYTTQYNSHGSVVKSITFSASYLLANDKDIDGNVLSTNWDHFSIGKPLTDHGTLIDNHNGTFTYKPDYYDGHAHGSGNGNGKGNGDDHGEGHQHGYDNSTVTFTYQTFDGIAWSNSAKVTIVVQPTPISSPGLLSLALTSQDIIITDPLQAPDPLAQNTQPLTGGDEINTHIIQDKSAETNDMTHPLIMTPKITNTDVTETQALDPLPLTADPLNLMTQIGPINPTDIVTIQGLPPGTKLYAPDSGEDTMGGFHEIGIVDGHSSINLLGNQIKGAYFDSPETIGSVPISVIVQDILGGVNNHSNDPDHTYSFSLNLLNGHLDSISKEIGGPYNDASHLISSIIPLSIAHDLINNHDTPHLNGGEGQYGHPIEAHQEDTNHPNTNGNGDHNQIHHPVLNNDQAPVPEHAPVDQLHHEYHGSHS